MPSTWPQQLDEERIERENINKIEYQGICEKLLFS